MKKLFVMVSIACAFAACSTEDAMDGTRSENNVSSSADRITYAEAIKTAEKAAAEMEDGQIRTLDLSKGVKAITQGTDTLLYVFNYKDCKGYTIVSATKKAPNFKITSQQFSLDPANVEDSAIVNYTRNYFVNNVINPKTLSIEIHTLGPGDGVRYHYDATLVESKSISNPSAKRDLLGMLLNNVPILIKEPTTMSNSVYMDALASNCEWALCFTKENTKYYATGYKKYNL